MYSSVERGLSRFMNHVESVEAKATGHWKAKGPAERRGMGFEIIKDDRIPDCLASRDRRSTTPVSPFLNAQPEEDNRGGRAYHLGRRHRGKYCQLSARNPANRSKCLRLLKQILETGDIMRSDTSIHPGMHPARPPAQSEIEKISGGKAWRPVTAAVPGT
jgi:hypothetical protein